jgi:hypothetical protein
VLSRATKKEVPTLSKGHPNPNSSKHFVYRMPSKVIPVSAVRQIAIESKPLTTPKEFFVEVECGVSFNEQ